jgi:hypothetical protein
MANLYANNIAGNAIPLPHRNCDLLLFFCSGELIFGVVRIASSLKGSKGGASPGPFLARPEHPLVPRKTVRREKSG